MSKANYTASEIDEFEIVKSNLSAFAGGTTDARGDENGSASGVTTIYTVTGEVLVRIFGVCTTVLAGASATVQVGLTGNTALLIALTTGTDIDADEAWFDSSPAIGDTLANVPGPFVIPNGLDIIETVATAPVTSGNVHYICLWRALSPDGKLVAA